jgi:hypothetical protein
LDHLAVRIRGDRAGAGLVALPRPLVPDHRGRCPEPDLHGAGPGATPNAFCGNAACIIDATCQAGANSIKDAYAKMEWVQGAFLYTCTTGLLNDSNPSSTNYALTANHCLSKASVARNVSFYWRFRTSSCNGACPSNSGWPYKTTGAGIAASNRSGDYTLLTLNTAPPAGSVRLGFTNAAVANTNGVALHRVSNPTSDRRCTASTR